MDFAFTPEDEAFRAELRDWLDENLRDFNDASDVDHTKGDARGLLRTMDRRKAWQRRLN